MERWQQPRHIGWSNWDNVLERDESGEPGDWCAPPVDGWAASDAGFTARHGNTNRTIMVFGDSAMGNPPSFSPNKANTILVFPSSPSYTPPSLTNFYARTGTGNWGSVANCKNYASGVTKPWMPEFSGDLGPSGNHWWWPGQAIVPAGSDTLHMFWYPVRCTNGEAFGNCDPPLDYHYTKDQKVCTIANINGSAINWATPTCSALSYVDGGVTKSPLDIGIIWGTGLMQEGSDIYYTSWEFLKVSGAHAHRCPDGQEPAPHRRA